jgi:hypothetical protein
MHRSNSLHSTARRLLRAILVTLALVLSGADLRAQGAGLTLGITAADRELLSAQTLTMEDMRKLAAVSTKFAELARRDRKVCRLIRQEAEAPDSPGDRSIAARARALEAEPVTRAALEASGVKAGDYVVIMLTHLTAMMDNFAKVTGRPLYGDPVKVNPANRQFLISHEKEIGKLFESVPDPCQ